MPSCLANSSKPTLARMIFWSFVIVGVVIKRRGRALRNPDRSAPGLGSRFGPIHQMYDQISTSTFQLTATAACHMFIADARKAGCVLVGSPHSCVSAFRTENHEAS